ncbi:MAG: nitroreductase family deazaflavin-dependent oxidoreductase [Gammaproteobacteria bacterium]|nr:nitroreductase family deazaflavin-dependent oxidoreductase [Gammaproteobacteria bacterium]
MRIPEPFFILINPTMRLLLRSPLHGLVSASLMLIAFTGRKSGQRFQTPVRYIRAGETIRCFTTHKTRWWRNLKGGATVTLRLRGRDLVCQAIAIDDDPARTRAALEAYLREFPQDAAYHDVRLGADHAPLAADIERAAQHAVLVEARPAGSSRATG